MYLAYISPISPQYTAWLLQWCLSFSLSFSYGMNTSCAGRAWLGLGLGLGLTRNPNPYPHPHPHPNSYPNPRPSPSPIPHPNQEPWISATLHPPQSDESGLVRERLFGE